MPRINLNAEHIFNTIAQTSQAITNGIRISINISNTSEDLALHENWKKDPDRGGGGGTYCIHHALRPSFAATTITLHR